MHKVAKPETVVRAVGVYEWTGDLAKPNASRLIPVTIYIDQHLEDAGVYLARPVPFVLQTGNIFELEEAGVPKGNLDLEYARHLQASNASGAYDDGWFGYGSFHAPPAPKKPVIRKQTPARTSGVETASSGDDAKPHFSNKAGQPAASDGAAKDDKPAAANDANTSTKPAADPERPTMKRRSSSGDAPAADTASTPADDPDRPTMKRRSADGSAADPAADTTSGSTAPSDDPDRPTLKRHSVEDAKKKAKADSEAGVSGTTQSLNDDPDRPNLHRGKPAHAAGGADLAPLSGLPTDLRQMVAVSDAANRPVHDFARPWEDDAERAAVFSKMQGMAMAQIAAYGATVPPAAAPTAPPRRPDSKRRAVSPVRIGVVGLLDEQLKGYSLSYGDLPAFVYQAHTDGVGAALRYVTIVAQRDGQGELKMVMHVVTDAAHLDRTPRLRLVDAVDAEASNRASLLFEMRGQTGRQFALFRLLGLQAEQIFSTGSMQ